LGTKVAKLSAEADTRGIKVDARVGLMLNSPLAKMSTAADFYASVKGIFDSFEAKDPGIKAKVCGVLGLPNTKISDAFTNTIDGCI
jgi:hypothetical protein